jgi:hypothetical protein
LIPENLADSLSLADCGDETEISEVGLIGIGVRFHASVQQNRAWGSCIEIILLLHLPLYFLEDKS